MDLICDSLRKSGGGGNPVTDMRWEVTDDTPEMRLKVGTRLQDPVKGSHLLVRSSLPGRHASVHACTSVSDGKGRFAPFPGEQTRQFLPTTG